MKKFLILTIISSAIITTTLNAQTGGAQAAAVGEKKENVKQQGSVDQAAMLQQMKEKFKQPMIEKTGLTEAQVDRVIEINLETRMAASGLRDLSETDRSAKLAELKAEKEKKFTEIPLTADQIQSVKTFYEEMGKSMGPKGVK